MREASRSATSRSLMLMLSYLGILGFVPLVAQRNDREVQWHAKNGLLLFAAVVGVGVAVTLAGIVLPDLSCLYGIVMFLAGALYVVIAVLAIVKALDGQRLIVPGISSHAGKP